MMQQSVEMAIGRDRVRKALGRYENKQCDRHVSGLVREVDDDGSYEVLLPGSTQTTKCAAYCSAKVGDVVLVVIRADRSCAAVGRLGGGSNVEPIVWGRSNGWYWEKWPNGRAICKKRVTLRVTGWNQWGSIYESKENTGAQKFPPGIFAETPSFEAKSAGASPAGSFIAGFGIGTNITESDAPVVYVLRGSSVDSAVDFAIDLCADGFWMVPDLEGGTSVLGEAVLGEMVLGKE